MKAKLDEINNHLELFETQRLATGHFNVFKCVFAPGETVKQYFLATNIDLDTDCSNKSSLSRSQEPTETSKQPIIIRYLGHVTGYQPIKDQYFLVWSVPVS